MKLRWLVGLVSLGVLNVPVVASATGVQNAAGGEDRFGQAVATGDFDCDGTLDLAVVAPGEGGCEPAMNIIYDRGLSDSFWLGTVSACPSPSTPALAELTVGDFDADGCDDVALGSEVADVGLFSSAGLVYVLYGSTSGLIDVGETWTKDEVGGTLQNYDHFGGAVGAGDFDLDGYDDLAVGVYGDGTGGGVSVIYGGSAGLSAVGAQHWDQDSSGISGNVSSGDDFGSSLAVGDFDGDAYPDLAIGVPGETVAGAVDAGAVNVIYGSTLGLVSSGNQLWYQGASGVFGTSEANDEFGSALAAGDYDGDGYDDLAIGLPGQTVGGDLDAGQIHILYGVAVTGLAVSSQRTFNQDTAGIGGGGEAGDRFGSALASGNFDGNAYDDLAVGVPGEATGTATDAGAVDVIYGTNNGLSTTNAQLWYEDSTGVVDVSEDGDELGYALATGDLDGDGYDDLIVGAPGEEVALQWWAGQVHLFGGSSTRLNATGDQVWNQDSLLTTFLP